MRYLAPVAMSEGTLGPSLGSVTNFPKTVEMVVDRVLNSAAAEGGTRRCPDRVSTEPSEKLLVAAKQGKSAV